MTERPPDAPEPDEPPVAEAGPPEPRCYRCGNPHDPFQEYCLECGARLVPLPGTLTRSTLVQRDSSFWFWAAFLGLLAIALVTAGIVLAARDTDAEAGASSSGPAPTTVPIVPPTTGITTGNLPTTVAPPTQSTSVPTFPTTTVPTFQNTTTGGTTTSGTTTGTTTNADGLTQWPANKDGWTIIVASVPKSDGRATAESKAKQAKNKGLPEVGVLDGDSYASLTNGYYAVFSVVADTKSEAQAHLPHAQSFYPGAYVKAVN